VFDLSFHSLQVLDVLFSTCSIVAMALYYCPINGDTYSALLLLSIGILVPLIANNPTSPYILGTTIGVSFLLLIALWIYHKRRTYCQCCYRYNLCCLCTVIQQAAVDSRKPDAFRRAPLGDSISLSSRSKKEVELSRLIKQGQYALVGDKSNKDQDEDQDGEDVLGTIQGGDDEIDEYAAANTSMEDISVEKIRNTAINVGSRLQFVIVGLVLGALGITFFALQRNDSYWYMHSLWQAFIMSSAYFLACGRSGFMKWMKYEEMYN